MDWRCELYSKILQQYAVSRSYATGVEYARVGTVSYLVASDDTIPVWVKGTKTYEVQLDVDLANPLFSTMASDQFPRWRANFTGDNQ